MPTNLEIVSLSDIEARELPAVSEVTASLTSHTADIDINGNVSYLNQSCSAFNQCFKASAKVIVSYA